MPDIKCNVVKIEPLTDVVSRVVLEPETPVSFVAGQYLRVVMSDKDRRPFSIANAPVEGPHLELHIGAGEGNQYAGEVLQRMQDEGEITIEGGLGNAHVREKTDRPTILMAGGTGFSYTNSILRHLLSETRHEPLFLYWGTKTLEDMYAYEVLTRLEQEHEHFTFVPVVEDVPENWQGKTGWVHKAVMADFVSLEPYQVYVAGRFEMAGVAREDFHNKGLLLDNLYGDAYEFI